MLKSALSSVAGPVTEQQLAQLQAVSKDATPQQLAWISGYFWGLQQLEPGVTIPNLSAVTNTNQNKLTIIYASQTGNAKGVAQQLAESAKSLNLPIELVCAADYKVKQLSKETHLILVASTHGEGEPPDNAVNLYEFLRSKKAPHLSQLQYAVLGLGDSSYEFFCQTAKDFDESLRGLGATPLAVRLEADVDYDQATSVWIDQTLAELSEQWQSSSEVVNFPSTNAESASASGYNKKNPYSAILLTNQKITGRDSNKDIRHLEFDLAGSGLSYQPGDALGVWFNNDPSLIDELLTYLAIPADTMVTVDDKSITITAALLEHYEITRAHPKFIEQYAELSASKKLIKLVGDKKLLREFANQTQIIDVLKTKKIPLTAEQLVNVLRRLKPRLYSIASSQEEVEEEAHLTVNLLSYDSKHGQRYGGASGYLAKRVAENEPVKIFIEPNDNFSLPADDKAMIMIGVGTGIAPFRGFIQAREQRGAIGENWLFFGERTFTQEFLYQSEWQAYLKSGLLTKISLAFSRDQAEKVYVQHRLKQQASDVWQWLENGAYIYVCGDAEHMAKDVHQALIDIVAEQGQKSLPEAEAYLVELRKNHRYQKDVY